MKLLGGILFTLFVLAAMVMPSQAVAAEEYNNQLKVTGVVLPAQHIIVNEQGMILEITSNTTQDVTPKVYVDKISKQTVREMSPEIYEQYRHLVPAGHSKVGVLYKYTPGTYTFTLPNPQVAPKTTPYMLPLGQ